MSMLFHKIKIKATTKYKKKKRNINTEVEGGAERGEGGVAVMAGAKNQHANKTKGETEVRPEMFNAHCLRVKCRMGGWHSLGGGKGVQADTGLCGRDCSTRTGPWRLFCLFVLFFFCFFLFDFYFWCLHIFADQASQRQGALWACGRRLRWQLGEGSRKQGEGSRHWCGCWTWLWLCPAVMFNT